MEKVTRKNCEYLVIFEHVFLKNRKGEPLRAKRIGNTKVWPMRHKKFSISVKIIGKGNLYFKITNKNCKSWLGDYNMK